MTVSFDLTGRTAVVVGGTTGIGRALALGLADAGADVVPTGRRAAVVDEVAGAIEAKGRRTLRMPADVGDAASLRALRDGCLKAFGRVDIVIAAAGVTKRVPTIEMSEADWDRIMNSRACCDGQACAPMIAQKSGGSSHRVDRVDGRPAGCGGVYREQGRRRRPHAVAGGRMGRMA